MKWRKLGRIFVPDGQYPWMASHAALPIARHLRNDCYRVYFSCRDEKGRSLPAYAEIDISSPKTILSISKEPLLLPGRPGTCDDSGVMLSWIVDHDNLTYAYYIGWNRAVTVPFRNSIGLATSADDGKTFSKYAEGPVLDRSVVDPYFTASSCVLIENGVWRMWYLSCTEWRFDNDRPKHVYHIRYAESENGIQWNPTGRVCIDFASEDEYAISRPCVLYREGKYRMWYSYRGDRYAIGYAESTDGVEWVRMDGEAGIAVSDKGWDSEMIEYPYVFYHQGTGYMLYNGNGYGKSGFGLAVLDDR